MHELHTFEDGEVSYVHFSLFVSHFRPGLEDLVKRMKSFGATEVVTEDFAASHRMKDLLTVFITLL